MQTLRLALVAKNMHTSVTPIIYGAFAKDIDVAITYDILDIDEKDFPVAVVDMRRTLDGATVTMPYKKTMLEYADAMDESASACGSINTIVIEDGKITGYNTDGWGMVKSLEMDGVRVAGGKVVMLGAGGVATSIAYSLKVNGVESVRVLDVIPKNAEELCARFGKGFSAAELTPHNLTDACRGATMLVNASILGQLGFPDFEDLSFLEGLTSDAVVFDVNYANPDAKLFPAARARGLGCHSGRHMSVCQGIRAMEIWTGRRPSDDCVRRVLAEI